jgi:hypothetical protein
MAKSELDRLYQLGMIGPWEYRNKLRGKPDTRDYLSGGGRGDDESMNGPDGHIHVIDAIDQREFQRPKRGAGFDDPRQQSANAPTGQGHIDQDKPAGGNWERLRKPDAKWTARTPSVSRARKSSADEYWSDDWFGDQSGNKRQER